MVNTDSTHLPIERLIADAEYSPQTIAAYLGNPLIEALPPLMDEEAILGLLTDMPSFSVIEKELPRQERFARLVGLVDFKVPLTRDIRLAFAIDTAMRANYVGRSPTTAEHVARLQDFYLARKKGISKVPRRERRRTALSAALIGLSGVGKTEAVRRILELFPQGIRHKQPALIQLTYVFLQCPHDGTTVRGLAIEFFFQIDKLLGTNYANEYVRKGSNELTLANAMASVAQRHCLGLLVIDEVQNMSLAPNADKKHLSKFIRLLVNDLGNALLLIGTNKAYDIVRNDFSDARRATGFGLDYWDRYLPSWELDKDPNLMSGAAKFQGVDEWSPFISALWRYQWTQQPAVLDDEMSRVLFDLTQGIPDVLIKLFIAAQFHAMMDGSERLTTSLFQRVFDKEFLLLVPMLDAIRSGDRHQLSKFDDLAPIRANLLFSRYEAQLDASEQKLTRAAQQGDSVESQIATALAISGAVRPETARKVAANAVAAGHTDALEGLKHAFNRIDPPKISKRKERTPIAIQTEISKLDDDDYRKVFWQSKLAGRSVGLALFDAQKDVLAELFGEVHVGLFSSSLSR
jgi:hypothetical protein